MAESLEQDTEQPTTARVREWRRARSKLEHLLRNAVTPIITLVGVLIPTLLAGNLIVEAVFNYPGLGLLFLNSLHREDYPVLLAYTLIGGALTVIGNFVADLVVARADRRIELGA